MTPKLKNILELALHPATGDGESVAALAAARRLIKTDPENNNLTAPVSKPIIQERIVYQTIPVIHETIVYRERDRGSCRDWNSTLPDKVFKIALCFLVTTVNQMRLELVIEKLSPNPSDTLATDMIIRVWGSVDRLAEFDLRMQNFVEKTRKEHLLP
jgi:hypothetical protein